MMGMFWARLNQSRTIVRAALLSITLALVAGCGDGNSVSDTPTGASAGTVVGQVVSSATSAPVSGATVKTSSGTITTAADGKFTVPAPAGDRTIVQVEANGFAEAFPVARVTSGQTTNLGVKLVPIGVTASISVASGDTVSVSGSTARVVIPANGLVPVAGGTPAGTVTVALTPINPATDPNLMPGGFTGVTAGGSSDTPIESFGVLGVDIRDAAGARYTLAPGKTATIRIPLGTLSSNPPTSIPLWYFNETMGVWQEEGTATLQVSGANRYYEGTVARFTPYWNADLVLDSILVAGCVKDASDQLVANALVQTEGVDYTGTAVDVTAADGTFSVAMRKSSQANLRVVAFDPQTFAVVSTSNIVKVGPSAIDISLTNCLVKQPGPLAITTAALPSGTVGVAYNQTLAASGGVPGYGWSLNAGSNPLPAGLELNPAGVLLGTPTADGTKTITIKVTDSTGAIKTKAFTLEIVGVSPPPPPPPPSLAITTTALPTGAVGTAYNATLAATGGTGNRTWSVTSGPLPNGLSLNESTGVISGTPTAAGASTVTIRVQDSATTPKSDQKSFALTINQTPPPPCGTNCLTVSNAPASVGGTFVVDSTKTVATNSGTIIGLHWVEIDDPSNPSHLETLHVGKDSATGSTGIVYGSSDPKDGRFGWVCASDLASAKCSGLTVDQSAGTATFVNVVLTPDNLTSAQAVTLNGTLTFKPF